MITFCHSLVIKTSTRTVAWKCLVALDSTPHAITAERITSKASRHLVRFPPRERRRHGMTSTLKDGRRVPAGAALRWGTRRTSTKG